MKEVKFNLDENSQNSFHNNKNDGLSPKLSPRKPLAAISSNQLNIREGLNICSPYQDDDSGKRLKHAGCTPYNKSFTDSSTPIFDRLDELETPVKTAFSTDTSSDSNHGAIQDMMKSDSIMHTVFKTKTKMDETASNSLQKMLEMYWSPEPIKFPLPRESIVRSDSTGSNNSSPRSPSNDTLLYEPNTPRVDEEEIRHIYQPIDDYKVISEEGVSLNKPSIGNRSICRRPSFTHTQPSPSSLTVTDRTCTPLQYANIIIKNPYLVSDIQPLVTSYDQPIKPPLSESIDIHIGMNKCSVECQTTNDLMNIHINDDIPLSASDSHNYSNMMMMKKISHQNQSSVESIVLTSPSQYINYTYDNNNICEDDDISTTTNNDSNNCSNNDNHDDNDNDIRGLGEYLDEIHTTRNIQFPTMNKESSHKKDTNHTTTATISIRRDDDQRVTNVSTTPFMTAGDIKSNQQQLRVSENKNYNKYHLTSNVVSTPFLQKFGRAVRLTPEEIDYQETISECDTDRHILSPPLTYQSHTNYVDQYIRNTDNHTFDKNKNMIEEDIQDTSMLSSIMSPYYPPERHNYENDEDDDKDESLLSIPLPLHDNGSEVPYIRNQPITNTTTTTSTNTTSYGYNHYTDNTRKPTRVISSSVLKDQYISPIDESGLLTQTTDLTLDLSPPPPGTTSSSSSERNQHVTSLPTFVLKTTCLLSKKVDNSMKELEFATCINQYTETKITLHNQRKRSYKIKAHAILTRFEPFPSSSSSSLTPHTMIPVPVPAVVVVDDSSADINNPFLVDNSTTIVNIMPHTEYAIKVRFMPTISIPGIYTGVLKIISSKKTFVILLRGVAVQHPSSKNSSTEKEKVHVSENDTITTTTNCNILQDATSIKNATSSIPSVITNNMSSPPSMSKKTIYDNNSGSSDRSDNNNNNNNTPLDKLSQKRRDILHRLQSHMKTTTTTTTTTTPSPSSPTSQQLLISNISQYPSHSNMMQSITTHEQSETSIYPVVYKENKSDHKSSPIPLTNRKNFIWPSSSNTHTNTNTNTTNIVSSSSSFLLPPETNIDRSRTHLSAGSTKPTVPSTMNTTIPQISTTTTTTTSNILSPTSTHLLYFRRSVINFGSAAVGTLTRVRIELCNASDDTVTVYLGDPSLPFVLFHNEVIIRPKCYIRIPLRFVPIAGPKQYITTLVAQTKDGNSQTMVTLIGNSY